MYARAFSLIEVLIVIGILAILSTGVFVAMSNLKEGRQLSSATDGVVFTLEQAKADALSGKSGVAHGVHFESNSYVRFWGSTYNASSPDNVTYDLPEDVTLQSVISGGGADIVFARLDARVSTPGTITLTDSTGGLRSISVAASGSISKSE